MKKILVSVLILAGLVMTGCENFLADTELKDKVNETINVAKSGTVKLKIEADRDYYGLFLDKMEGDFTFKTAQTVTVRFQLDPSCSFKRWMIADSVSGKEIEDAVKVIEEITETENGSEVHTIKFTFLKSLPNLQLKPVCFLKNDTTAPEFTAFEVYNLGTYDEENEENNVLVTDKVFEEWTEDEDFENHHVNGLTLKFTVREDGDFRFGSFEVVEKQIKDIEGNSLNTTKVINIYNAHELNEDYGVVKNNNNGTYDCIINYKFHSQDDGVIKFTIMPVDIQGNYNREKSRTYYIIKDTMLNLYKNGYNNSGLIPAGYDDTLFTFYYLPTKILNKTDSSYSNNAINNFLYDTRSGGYATPEGFSALLSKYYFDGTMKFYDKWYSDGDKQFTTEIVPEITFSTNDSDYEKIDLIYERLKYPNSLDVGTEGNPLFDEIDAYYMDTSAYSKHDEMFFKFVLLDETGNIIEEEYNNLDSIPPVEITGGDYVEKSYSLQTYYGSASADGKAIYEWRVNVKPKFSYAGKGYAASNSLGCFYYTVVNGVKSNIMFEPSFGYTYYGNENGQYMSAAEQVAEGSSTLYISENPDIMKNAVYYVCNVPGDHSYYYDFEIGRVDFYSYKNVSDFVEINISNLTEITGINKGDINFSSSYPEVDSSGKKTGTYYIDAYNNSETFDQFIIECFGKQFKSLNSSTVRITGLTKENLKNGFSITAEAYLDGERCFFETTYYGNGFEEANLPSTRKNYEQYSINFEYDFPELFAIKKEADYKTNLIELKIFDDRLIDADSGSLTVRGYYSSIDTTAEIKQLPYLELNGLVKTFYNNDDLHPVYYQVLAILFDSGVLLNKTYNLYLEVTDADANTVFVWYEIDNTLLEDELNFESLETVYYIDPYGWGSADGTLYKECLNSISTDFVYMYFDRTFADPTKLNRHSNTVYYQPESYTYYLIYPKEDYEVEITKDEKLHYDANPSSDYYTKSVPDGVTQCKMKNILKNEEDGTFSVYCDQNVLVEYILSDKFVSPDLPYYWEHLNSNGNKTFTQLTVANPGQTTVKGYKIPKVPAGKYGFIIFHFADGTSMNSGVIEG